MNAKHLTLLFAFRPQSLKKENSLMKMSLSQMIALICILSGGFITVAPFISEVEAHPKEVHQRSIVDLYVCEEDMIIQNTVVLWGISEVVVPHDPDNDHEMKIRTFIRINKIIYIDCYGSMA